MRTAMIITSLILFLIGIIMVITNPDRATTISFGMVLIAAGIIILVILVNFPPKKPVKKKRVKKKKKR